MNITKIPDTMTSNTWPTCLILPSNTGSTTNCIQATVPSIATMIWILIISWISFMIVAYFIYYFLDKVKPNTKYNYWAIFIILILAGIIVSLFTRLF